MNIKIKIGLLSIVVLFAATATITMIQSQSSRNTNSQKQQKSYGGDVPVVDYSASSSPNLRQDAAQSKRSKRGNMKLGKETGVFDSERFKITEERDSSYGGFPTHAPAEPAIPAGASDVVIAGEVLEGKAFLSEDKTSVFSEFTIKVNRILKNSTSETINAGDSISISRGGGAVRFPSGKVIRNLFDGKPMPEIGGEYVMFLKYDAEAKDYPMITGYQFKDDRVIPLDGIQIDGQVVEQLASHQGYKGMNKTDFLNLVQYAINNSRNLFGKEEK